MHAFTLAMLLLSGTVGAGFASGRELMHFFVRHGALAPLGSLLAAAFMALLLLRLSRKLQACPPFSLRSLCSASFGRGMGALCGVLFFLLMSITGAAMLSACAELLALLLPLHAVCRISLPILALACLPFCLPETPLSALLGMLLLLALPVFFTCLFLLPSGEYSGMPSSGGLSLLTAGVDALLFASLNTALLAGLLPVLCTADDRLRKRGILLFASLLFLLLTSGSLLLLRQYASCAVQPLPFVLLSRDLGVPGYVLCAVTLLISAFSTLSVMLIGMSAMLPLSRTASVSVCSLLCLLLSRIGFAQIVSGLYPVLGLLCAALLILLCLPSSRR